MRWLVVKFTTEMSVEAVPSSWYIASTGECFWPPKGTRPEKVLKFIRDSVSPECNWKGHPAVLLGKYVTPDGKRKRRSRKTPPQFREMRYYDPNSKSFREFNNSGHTQSIQGQTRKNDDSNNNIFTSVTSDSVLDQAFKKTDLEELSLINIKVDGFMGRMVEMTKIINLNNADPSCLKPTNNNLFYSKIPIKTIDELTILEQWLGSNKENYRVMILELNRIGGSGLAQSVRKIVYRTLRNEIAENYSWDGAKQKRAFKNFRLAKGIVETIMTQYRDATETEIINLIKLWLVKAKERIK